MDLSDLYTPQELAEKRIDFLERVLEYWEELPDTLELGKMVGHKLRGTGGTLGLDGLSKTGEEIQNLVIKGGDQDVIARMLQRVKPEMTSVIEQEKKVLDLA
jgi:hypothetical protein